MGVPGWDETALQELALETGCEKVDVGDPGAIIAAWVALILVCLGCTVAIAAGFRMYIVRRKQEDEEEEQEVQCRGRKPRPKPVRREENVDPTPNLDAAKEHLRLSSPVDANGNWRDLWATPMKELGEIGGPGLGLYFQMLLYLGVSFTIMFILSLPLLMFSSLGDFAPEEADSLPQSMIANLGTPATAGVAQENRLVVIGCDAVPLSSMTRYFGWLDFLGILLYTGCTLWLRFVKVPKEHRLLDAGRLDASDFTVEVDGLPRRIADHANYEEHLRNHMLQQVLRVRASSGVDVPEPRICEVVLVRDRGMELGLVKQRAQYSLDKEIADYKGDEDKSAKLQGKIDDISSKLSISHQSETDLDVLRAYVTVNCTEDVSGLLSRYRLAQFWILSSMQSESMRFEGEVISLQRAPEPSNILWDNQDVPWKLRVKRGVIVALICIFIVGCGLGLMFATTKQAVNFTRKYEKPGSQGAEICNGEAEAQEVTEVCNAKDWVLQNVEGEYVLFESANGPRVDPQGQDEIDCFCSVQGLSSIAQSGTLRSFCSDLIAAYSFKLTVTVGAALIVVVVNVLMSSFLVWVAAKELPLSVSELNSAQMMKVFAAQTLNTAFVLFAVHYNNINDFKRGWYVIVGASICMTMASNTVVNAVCYYVMWAVPLLKRWCASPEGKHQLELLELYTNPPFDMASRYAYLLMTVYVTLIYSSGLPVLYLLAALYCLISYWTDKHILLWGSCRPPQFDEIMPTRSAKWLAYAGTLHCLTAIAMYGQPCVFPSNPLGGTLGELSRSSLDAARDTTNVDAYIPNEKLEGMANTFADRLTRDSTWMFAGMLFGMLAAYCFYAFLVVMGRTVGECCKLARVAFFPTRVVPVEALQSSWAEAAVEIQRERPPATYRMEEHPDFTRFAKYLTEGSQEIA
mmetsp:Transcript_61827/g.143878  ORF Transcript_61827/g.143878 Transcript_61827/m.143878 type:complete len:913 (+) Transcript_61827:40-2778(+)